MQKNPNRLKFKIKLLPGVTSFALARRKVNYVLLFQNIVINLSDVEYLIPYYQCKQELSNFLTLKKVTVL